MGGERIVGTVVMSDVDRNLIERTAWVIGGATGMGRTIALALSRAGADVAIGSFLLDDMVRILSGRGTKMLHGRIAFTGLQRDRQICSVSRDEFLSPLRVLGRKYGRDCINLTLSRARWDQRTAD